MDFHAESENGSLNMYEKSLMSPFNASTKNASERNDSKK